MDSTICYQNPLANRPLSISCSIRDGCSLCISKTLSPISDVLFFAHLEMEPVFADDALCHIAVTVLASIGIRIQPVTHAKAPCKVVAVHIADVLRRAWRQQRACTRQAVRCPTVTAELPVKGYEGLRWEVRDTFPSLNN